MRSVDWLLSAFSVLLPACLLVRPLRRSRARGESLGTFAAANRLLLATAAALCLGMLLRLVGLGSAPAGFNQDEASVGYDAWAILNYGVDRNGVRFPVHLIAWGSGQNALYAYLCMPFLKLLGLTVFAVRLPMALVGCASLFGMRALANRLHGPRFAALATLALALMPWHIMKSRWALESNLLPDLVLLAVLLLTLALPRAAAPDAVCSVPAGKTAVRPGLLAAGSAVLGLCAYAYGTSYFFLPVFCLILFGGWALTGRIRWRHAVLCVGIVGLVSLPIVLFVFLNTFGGTAIVTPLFTIPKLNEARQAQVLNLSGPLPAALLANLKANARLLLLQTDGLAWNSMPFYGTVTVAALPFTLLGLISACRRRGGHGVFLAWGAAALLMLCVMNGNLNRINLVWLPQLYFTAWGLWLCVRRWRAVRLPALGAAALLCVGFCTQYFGSYQTQIGPAFFAGLGEAVRCASHQQKQTVCITKNVNQPYIFALFYGQVDPRVYAETVQKDNPGAAFEAVDSFAGYRFIDDDTPWDDRGACYIVSAEQARQMAAQYPDATVVYEQNYAVAWFL
jgi:hypothetical protein